MSQDQSEQELEPQPVDEPQVNEPRDTSARSLGVPAFWWSEGAVDGTELHVDISVDLPKEPPGASTGEDVVYQVWGFMQDTAAVPNAVAWDADDPGANRLLEETTAASTPFTEPRGLSATWGLGVNKPFFATQVTVRRAGTTDQIDQTIKVYPTPPAPRPSE